MSRRVDLPNGAWADLREPAQVPERLRRPVLRLAVGLGPTVKSQQAMSEGGLSVDALDQFAELNDVSVVALVSAWSFDAPITVDALLDLPGDAYDALRSVAAPLVAEMLPSFEVSPDRASPTTPSSD